MTWLALRDDTGARALAPALPAGGIARGTLLFEIDLARLATTADPLLRLTPHGDPQRILVLERGPDARLHLFRRAGAQVSVLSVGIGRSADAGKLRLTYHWDAGSGRAVLTAERLATGTLRQHEGRDAMALGPAELAALFAGGGGCRHHSALDWVALADHWQPVGPIGGLAGDTPIDTPEGPRPIRTIRPGDRVLTADAGAQPVLWQGGVRVPACGSFRPVRIEAPGFARRDDLVALPDQRIAMSGAEVEYLCGEDEVLVPAHHLATPAAADASGDGTAIWHGLLLAEHHLIRSQGLWLSSLYLGRLAQNPDVAATTAPGSRMAPGHLPRHAAPARRDLHAFEAAALALTHHLHHRTSAA
ncbi:MAG: hypothetical protein CVT84_13345 [Alphaproteobacteria bacterium HGW-Alphaproteobacteria-6]|nr:MAG: hypothetical protein CVT84_13345 [Alphaproteobacteria bacterium HGW-Alphaproteobacteria-6]